LEGRWLNFNLGVARSSFRGCFGGCCDGSLRAIRRRGARDISHPLDGSRLAALPCGVPALGLRHLAGLRQLCQTRPNRRALEPECLGNVPRSRARMRAQVRKKQLTRLTSTPASTSLAAPRRSRAAGRHAPRRSTGGRHSSIKRRKRCIKTCRLLHQRTQLRDARIDLPADVVDQIGHCAAVLHDLRRRPPLMQVVVDTGGCDSRPEQRLITGLLESDKLLSPPPGRGSGSLHGRRNPASGLVIGCGRVSSDAQDLTARVAAVPADRSRRLAWEPGHRHPPSEEAKEATEGAWLFTASPTRGRETRWRRQQLTPAARIARSRTSSARSA
jgi:hypothetical protein